MSLWKPDSEETLYLTNLQNEVIRAEYNRRRQQLGLPSCQEMSDRQRRDFDRDMVAKYGEDYPPPGRTPYLFQIWDMLEASGQLA